MFRHPADFRTCESADLCYQLARYLAVHSVPRLQPSPSASFRYHHQSISITPPSSLQKFL